MLDTENTDQFEEIALEDQARLVLGGCEGWPLAPVIDWLISKDSRFTDPAEFLKALCNSLLNVGAPLDRIRLSFRTIHPQVAALSYIWESNRTEIETMQIGHGFKDTEAFKGSPADTMMSTGEPVRFKIADIDVSKEHEAIQDVADTGATDYLGLPMLTSTGDVHNMFISTNREAGFTDCDIQKLKRLSQHIQAKVELLATQRLAIALLDTYVGKRTGQRVLDGQIKRGQGEEIQAALWFSDLRDFTLLTETLPPEDLLELLNEYFELVYNSVTKYGGEVLRFIGDAMLIVFTAENSSTGCLYGASEGAFSASEMAYKELEEINARRKEEGKPVFNFGVGLHEGTVTYGNVGAPDRLDFTVMGPAVNRTARLESKTKELGRRRLMSREFAEKLSKPIESLGFFNLKGIGEKQEICAVAR